MLRSLASFKNSRRFLKKMKLHFIIVAGGFALITVLCAALAGSGLKLPWIKGVAVGIEIIVSLSVSIFFLVIGKKVVTVMKEAEASLKHYSTSGSDKVWDSPFIVD